jgi:hypothetical protein
MDSVAEPRSLACSWHRAMRRAVRLNWSGHVRRWRGALRSGRVGSGRVGSCRGGQGRVLSVHRSAGVMMISTAMPGCACHVKASTLLLILWLCHVPHTVPSAVAFFEYYFLSYVVGDGCSMVVGLAKTSYSMFSVKDPTTRRNSQASILRRELGREPNSGPKFLTWACTCFQLMS